MISWRDENIWREKIDRLFAVLSADPTLDKRKAITDVGIANPTSDINKKSLNEYTVEDVYLRTMNVEQNYTVIRTLLQIKKRHHNPIKKINRMGFLGHDFFKIVLGPLLGITDSVLILPSSLNKSLRYYVHKKAAEYGWRASSYGKGKNRCIHVNIDACRGLLDQRVLEELMTEQLNIPSRIVAFYERSMGAHRNTAIDENTFPHGPPLNPLFRPLSSCSQNRLMSLAGITIDYRVDRPRQNVATTTPLVRGGRGRDIRKITKMEVQAQAKFWLEKVLCNALKHTVHAKSTVITASDIHFALEQNLPVECQCVLGYGSTLYRAPFNKHSIHRLLNQVSPTATMTHMSWQVVSDMCTYLCKTITVEAVSMSRQGVSGTSVGVDIRVEGIEMTTSEIEYAVRLALGGVTSKHAVTEGSKAVERYEKFAKPSFLRSEKNMDSSFSEWSGLQCDVSEVAATVFEVQKGLKLSTSAAVYLAAVLEFMITELLQLASNTAYDQIPVRLNRRITPHHIMLSIRSDVELRNIFSNMAIGRGSVGVGFKSWSDMKPNVNSFLLPASFHSRDWKGAGYDRILRLPMYQHFDEFDDIQAELFDKLAVRYNASVEDIRDWMGDDYRTGHMNYTFKLQQIREEQKNGDLILDAVDFKVLAYLVGKEVGAPIDFKVSDKACVVLQSALEYFLVGLLQCAILNSISEGRIDLQPKDIQLARQQKDLVELPGIHLVRQKVMPATAETTDVMEKASKERTAAVMEQAAIDLLLRNQRDLEKLRATKNRLIEEMEHTKARTELEVVKTTKELEDARAVQKFDEETYLRQMKELRVTKSTVEKEMESARALRLLEMSKTMEDLEEARNMQRREEEMHASQIEFMTSGQKRAEEEAIARRKLEVEAARREQAAAEQKQKGKCHIS